MSKILPIIAVWLVLAGACTTSSPRYGASKGKAPDIRVLLAEGAASYRVSSSDGLTVESTAGLELVEATGQSTVRVGLELATLNVEVEPGGALAAAEDAVIIKPRGAAKLGYDGLEYAGVIKVVAGDNGGLRLLNVLPMETYLEGVLPYEIGDPGPDGYDAVKSQAVAARTYALSKMQQRKQEQFDVYASVMDQVYKGTKGRTKVASAAVRDTRGRVLDFQGKMVRAYYSACCGGHTSDIRLVWPDREPAAYLHGIPDRDGRRYRAFCTDYKAFRWRYSFSGKEMGRIIRRTLPHELGVNPDDVGILRDIRVEERSQSGRVTKLLITTSKGEFTITGDRIRWVLMPDVDNGRILPSVLFRLDKMMERDQISFVSIVGGGNGHGVGMCQNGAIGMAKAGYTYSMILEHYYPGATVVEAY